MGGGLESRWVGRVYGADGAVPEAAVTVFSTPDDGCCDTRNM